MAIKPIFGLLAYYIIMLVFTIILIYSILALVGTIPCKRSKGGNMFEPFKSSPKSDKLSQIQNKLIEIEKVKTDIATIVDEIPEMEESVCEIMNQVQDSYISASAAPPNESEYNLAAEVQTKRQDDRRTKAEKKFNREKEEHNKKMKGFGPMIECFEDSAIEGDVGDAEIDLSVAVDDFKEYLESDEIKTATMKGLSLLSSLTFTEPYVRKALSAVAPAKTKTKEGFAVKVKGLELFEKANSLLAKAFGITETFQRVRNAIQQQKQASDSLNAKANNIQKGKISQSDIDSSMTKATSKKKSKSDDLSFTLT